MRVAGTLLLIGGFLLCVSIVWAAPGFLMMGFGLICLLVAERRQKRLAVSPVSRSNKIAARQEPSLFPAQEEAQFPAQEEAPPQGSTTRRPHEIGVRREPSRLRERKNTKPTGSEASRLDQIDPRREPSRFRGRRNAQPAGSATPHSGRGDLQGEPTPFREPEEPNPALVVSEERTDRRENAIDPYSHDAEKWGLLVKNDPDISRAAAALAPFGKKYVDELAKAYLVLNDKDYLPIIFKKIAAAVRKGSGKDTASTAAPGSDPNDDLISFALNETQSLRMQQVLDVRTVRDTATDEPAPVNNAPQMEPDTKPQRAAIQSAPSRGRPERGASAAARDPEVEETDTRRTVKLTAMSPARREVAGALGPDDVEGLTNLLNNLDLGARASAKR
jgi:hypothetical protein